MFFSFANLSRPYVDPEVTPEGDFRLFLSCSPSIPENIEPDAQVDWDELMRDSLSTERNREKLLVDGENVILATWTSFLEPPSDFKFFTVTRNGDDLKFDFSVPNAIARIETVKA